MLHLMTCFAFEIYCLTIKKLIWVSVLTLKVKCLWWIGKPSFNFFSKPTIQKCLLWFCRELDSASFGKRVITKDWIENFLWPKHRDRHYLWATRYYEIFFSCCMYCKFDGFVQSLELRWGNICHIILEIKSLFSSIFRSNIEYHQDHL